MSKSGSDPRVEDVLTSVRRLVSNEVPRNRRADLPAGPGALVLTDAQRVETAPNSGKARKSLEDRIAELEAAVSVHGGDFEPDGSEDQAQHRPDRIVYTRPPTEDEESSARRNTLRLSQIALVGYDEESGEDEVSEIATPTFRHGASEAVGKKAAEDGDDMEEAPMAEDVPSERPKSAEISAFTKPEDVIDRIEARLKGSSPAVPPTSSFAIPFPSRKQPSVDVPIIEPKRTETADAGDTEEAFDEALNEALKPETEIGVESEYEEDHSGQEDLSDEELAAVPEEAEASAPQGDAALEDILDEESLRPIIAKLIREEFQGELGERITRNIRKLVRREILRALNSKSVE